MADLLAKAGPLAAIAVSMGAVASFDLGSAGVRLVGDVPAGLPPLALPRFDPGLWRDLLPAAVLISFVGFVESVSVGQTLAAKRRQRVVPNRELAGLGASNVAAALSGGYPVTGGFARSVVNFDAGAATPLAGVFTAVGILLAALFLTPVFRFLPQAILAATIVVAVLSLVDLAALRRIYAYSRPDFAAMAATIVLVLLAGVEAGIVAGVALSLILFLWRTSMPHIAIVGMVPGTEHFRNVARHQVITAPDLLSVRVDESLYFANARVLEDRILAEVAARPGLRNVVLMCSAVNVIDASALESLEAIAARLGAAGIGFHLSEVKGPVMDRLRRSDFLAHFQGRIFLSQYDAFLALAGPAAASDRAGRRRANLPRFGFADHPVVDERGGGRRRNQIWGGFVGGGFVGEVLSDRHRSRTETMRPTRLPARYAGQDPPTPRIRRSRSRRRQTARRPAFDMPDGMAFVFLSSGWDCGCSDVRAGGGGAGV